MRAEYQPACHRVNTSGNLFPMTPPQLPSPAPPTPRQLVAIGGSLLFMAGLSLVLTGYWIAGGACSVVGLVLVWLA